MMKNSKHKNKYNHYTEDFRREAVRRSDDPNTSAVEVARELGIHVGQIYNWRQQCKRLSGKQFDNMNGVDYSQQESEEVRKLKREIADLKEGRDFLKKRRRTSRIKNGEVPSPEGINTPLWIHSALLTPLKKMCRWPSSRWLLQMAPSRTQRAGVAACAHSRGSRTHFERYKKRYGAPRIAVELNELGIACSDHIARPMNEVGLRARNGKNFKFFLSSDTINHVSDNLLGRDFSATEPNEKGYLTLRTLNWIAVLLIWPWSWICSHGKSSAGRWIQR